MTKQEQEQAKVSRTMTGVVVSATADKTVRVRVERRIMHRLYGKVLRRSNHFLAHDEDNTYRVGDAVVITECRRRSKRKAWAVTSKADKAK